MTDNNYLNMGIQMLQSCGFKTSDSGPGISFLERGISERKSGPYSDFEIQSIAMIGYYYGSTHNCEEAKYWLSKIADINTEWNIYYNQLSPLIPETEEQEKLLVKDLTERLDNLLNSSNVINVNLGLLNQTFWYSYYNYNPKTVMEKYALLQMKTFPEISNQNYLKNKTKNDKIKIGVFSCSLIPNIDIYDRLIHSSSISDSFYPTFQQLPDNEFEVVYIHFGSSQTPDDDKNIYIQEVPPIHSAIKEVQQRIANLNLDILIFLEFHMKPITNYIALSRLAPIQICTHGHPVTTGMPRSVMDYFLSWEAAEIPNAKEHYTEELVLIDKNIVWEYFIPRNTPGHFSLLSNSSWGHYTKYNMDFVSHIDPNMNWYFCPQATFKFHITFDRIINDILNRDRNSVVILISNKNDLYTLNNRHCKRLTHLGIDLSRVVFVDKLAHHQLMAMYKNCDVILDSYFFGGDTTTREAFEVGAPLVTLPSHMLGGRWSQAYYKQIGVTDLIATDPENYVELAIRLANDDTYANEIREKIIKNKDKLFHRKEAIKGWADMFKKLHNKNN